MKLTYMLFVKTLIQLLVIYVCSTYAADAPNPVFWERSFTMNITSANNIRILNQSSSFMATSQDFQGIHLDSNTRNPPDRIIFNFGESCQSSNITIDMIRQINFNNIDVTSIMNAQKIALVKRGNCNWSEKVSVVNTFALTNRINITAVFIYDNDTHGTNITIDRTPVTGSGSIDPPSYPTALPAVRSITNMSDNDLAMTSPSTTVVYFLPFVYGNTFVQRLNASYDPRNPTLRQYWLLTPYLEEVSWGYSSGDGFFSTGRGYLSYIIALAAIFLIGAIFLRWWRIRRMRTDYPSGFNGFTTANGFSMQPRINQLDPLPVDIVNSLPIDKYSVDLIKNVNCAICLEDFVPGKNDIRILPCGHGFCVLCIDPWLTQKSTMCPICKWDCLPVHLRQERNQQQQQQQHQLNGQPEHNDATTIDMGVPGPSSSLAIPEVQHVENNAAENTATRTATTATTTTRIIPPTLLPSASPPPSPPHAFEHRDIERKGEEVSHLENPFEECNAVSETITSHSGESSCVPPPAFSNDEKKSPAPSDEKKSSKD